MTHIHILPSYDYNSVDEANLAANRYNWGYDPSTTMLPKAHIPPIRLIRSESERDEENGQEPS